MDKDRQDQLKTDQESPIEVPIQGHPWEETEGESPPRAPSMNPLTAEEKAAELSALRRQAALTGEVDLDFEPVPPDSTYHIPTLVDLVDRIPESVRGTVRIMLDGIHAVVSITAFTDQISAGVDLKKIVPLTIYYIIRYTRFWKTPED